MIQHLLALAFFALPQPPTATPRVAVTHTIVLKVADRDATADAVIAAAEKHHGYFVVRSNDSVHLKIPAENVKAAMNEFEPLGTVIARTVNAVDIGEQLDEQRTRLLSRETMLQRYFAVIAAAGAGQVVEVEQTMTSLVQEIETIRGNLLLREHQLRYADVEVSFQFHDRQAPVRTGNSSFAWLNSVNLQDLLEEFGHEEE